MSNMWTNKTVAFQPLFNDSNRYLGFAVVDKELKYFYPPTVDYSKLLSEAKHIIVFNNFLLEKQLNNSFYTKHNFQSLYFQLNSEIKFQNIFDIVKAESYSTKLNNVHYITRVEGARKCVVAANFMLEYYLENYKKANKDILKLDNALLENFSIRNSYILVDQTKLRTELSLYQKEKWDLERNLFKRIGYPVWNSLAIEDSVLREDQEIIEDLEKIKDYKNQIDYLEKYLNIFKINLEFDITATSTGRIICRDRQNNIGLFAPDNRYKNLFYCKDNKIFVSFDYKRQEAFILATVSKDEQLYEDIQNNDFYSRLARWVLKDTSKQTGKTLFYAVIYGSSIKSLAESFNISEEKAEEAIDKVKSRYRKLSKWLINFKEKKNYFSRPLYKKTVNAYIQSTAADLIRQKLIDTIRFNPVLVLADNIIYKISKENYIETSHKIQQILMKTPFEGLYTEPQISNTLEFESIPF